MDRQSDGALAVTWVGHATVLIELAGTRILTDPVLHGHAGPLRRIASPVHPDVSERIDAVLLSHLHADHVDLRSLRSLGEETPILAPRGAGAWLTRQGFSNVQEVQSGDVTTVGEARITATPASHSPGRRPLGALKADPLGFIVEGVRSVYFAGDTDLFDGMAQLAGKIDLALLPVWGWGPTLGPGHLDPRRAVTAALRIAPQIAVPIHWGTLTLPRPARPPRDPLRPAREFAELMAVGAPDVEVRVLMPGERLAPEDGWAQRRA